MGEDQYERGITIDRAGKERCYLLEEGGGGGGGVKIMYIVNETLSTSGEWFIFVWQATAALLWRICGRGVVEGYYYRQGKEMCYLLEEGAWGGGGALYIQWMRHLVSAEIDIFLFDTPPPPRWSFWWNLSCESIVRKISEGETLIRTQSTTLFQIFYKIIFNFQVISKSIVDPDDNIKRSPLSVHGFRRHSILLLWYKYCYCHGNSYWPSGLFGRVSLLRKSLGIIRCQKILSSLKVHSVGEWIGKFCIRLEWFYVLRWRTCLIHIASHFLCAFPLPNIKRSPEKGALTDSCLTLMLLVANLAKAKKKILFVSSNGLKKIG